MAERPRHERPTTRRPARPRIALAPMWPAIADDPAEVDEQFLLSPWREGWRCLIVLDDRIRLRARSGRDLAPLLPRVVEALRACRLPGSSARPTILDGLVAGIAAEEGDAGDGAAAEGVVVVDVLCREGRDLTGLDLSARQAEMRSFRLPDRAGGVSALETWRGDATAALEQAARAGSAGHGGLLARRTTSPYRPGICSREWLVFPERRLAEFVLCGVTHAGALVLGKPTSHGLVFAGLTWPSRVWSRLALRCREGSAPFAPPSIWPSLGSIAWARPEIWVAAAPEVRPSSGTGGPRWRFVRVQEDLSL